MVAAGPVPLLGVDDLVGRRREVRTAVRALTSNRDRGVSLVGMGGVGKSTVAGRVMQRLREDGWAIAIHAGPFSIAALCAVVRDALDEIADPAAGRLVNQLGDEQADDQLRLGRLVRAVRDHRVLLVLDNFEDNLSLGGDTFRDEVTAVVTATLVGAAGVGRLLVTSRYPLPGVDGLRDVRVTPLSPAQARKLLLRLPGLDALTGTQARELLRHHRWPPPAAGAGRRQPARGHGPTAVSDRPAPRRCRRAGHRPRQAPRGSVGSCARRDDDRAA